MKKRTYKFQPCPDPLKGTRCPVCGSAYICTQTWRKTLDKNGKRTDLPARQATRAQGFVR